MDNKILEARLRGMRKEIKSTIQISEDLQEYYSSIAYEDAQVLSFYGLEVEEAMGHTEKLIVAARAALADIDKRIDIFGEGP